MSVHATAGERPKHSRIGRRDGGLERRFRARPLGSGPARQLAFRFQGGQVVGGGGLPVPRERSGTRRPVAATLGNLSLPPGLLSRMSQELKR